MPPKKDAGPAPVATGPNYTPEQQAERIVLIEECKRLRDIRLQEQADYAQFTDEKEKLNALWAQTKKNLEDTKAELRQKEREKQELADEHALEIKLHKQRIKHLLYEHQNDTVDSHIDTRLNLKGIEEKHTDSERDLKADYRDLKVTLKELERNHEELARALKMEADRNLTHLRHSFEREANELQQYYEDKMIRTREELTTNAENDIRNIEKRKTAHIKALIASHEKAFGDIKLYYNEITHSNLDLIKSLKEEVEDLRKKELGDERVMYSIASENKKMSEPLRKALDQVRTLKEARDTYRADITALHETKAAVLVVQDRIENLRWEHEILQQRYDILVNERDSLYNRFTRALHEVKQKAGFRALMLEERVSAASEAANKAGTMLKEVVAAANISGGISDAGAKGLNEDLQEKDQLINALKTELERIATAHDNVIRVCFDAMHAVDIPKQELGFVPLSSYEILQNGSSNDGNTGTN